MIIVIISSPQSFDMLTIMYHELLIIIISDSNRQSVDEYDLNIEKILFFDYHINIHLISLLDHQLNHPLFPIMDNYL
jgi:hypothetical protein